MPKSMETPIYDFVAAYAASDTVRFHMPGHKGIPRLGCESLDITEIAGADALYEADGIIAKSEENAGKLFGCRTLYGTEGSSQCIRAMVCLLQGYAKLHNKKPLLAAGRNAHKSFLTAAALLGVEVDWLYPSENPNYLACNLQPGELETYFRQAETLPTAVYLTSPDYLGNIPDLAALAAVCHRYGVLLAVDNAHGAYLKFLPKSLHPMDLGADICCDSAHKTLPVLTGGAYLHLADSLDAAAARRAMSLFGSTSPSYLILQSLDAANVYLETYPPKLAALLPAVEALKNRLRQRGYTLLGNEPLKLTIHAKAYGYEGTEFADLLRRQNIEPEFADPDQVVLLLSAQTDETMLGQLEAALAGIEKKQPLQAACIPLQPPGKKMSIREAMLSLSETLPAEECLGRILAVPTVGCPPAVPILVCGEEIDQHALTCFAYYGIETCCVVKETVSKEEVRL